MSQDINEDSGIRLERDAQGIAWLTLDKPDSSANVLGRGMVSALDARLKELEASPPVGVVLISAKPSGFIAGADIKEFTGLTSEEGAYALIRAAQGVLERLEALPCPSVAAIHGFALGGGLELALACHYRVALGDSRLQLGLPEVQLGIHPGFGGTVRAVRLLGVRPAMQLMLTGKPVRATKALQLGLIDRLLESEEALRATARELVLRRPPRRRAPLAERVLGLPPLRPLVQRLLTAQVAAKARREHYPAPYAIIELWSRHGAHGPAAYEAEAHSIARLFLTPTSRNLVRVFLLQDRLKSGSRGGAEIQRVHVVGAGVMGGDIAAWAALRGFTVTLQDKSLELVHPALTRAGELFNRRLRGDAGQILAASQRLRADVAGEAVARADVVIEAVFESLEVKQALYAQLEPRMQPEALLATNTSSILLEPLAAQLARPGRLVGLHFFNPVPQMPLVEVVQGARTEAAATAAAAGFARRLDKLPVPCRSAPGFIVNRVLMPYLHEAMYAAREGVPMAVIDQCALDFGMPMGPIELADVVGLDVAAHVSEILAHELGRTPPDLSWLHEKLKAGKLGKKTGEGFYRWHNGKPLKTPGPGSPAGNSNTSAKNGAHVPLAPPDLTDRLMLVLANECVALLREGVVEDADLIDAAVIFGTGFAPFRGGPLTFARDRGIAATVTRLIELGQRYGERFRPDAGWKLLERGAAGERAG